MIKKTCGVLVSALLLGLMSSCSDDNPWLGSEGHGTIKLSFSTDGTLNDGTPQTRADADELFSVPTASEFSIRLEHSATGKVHEFGHDKFINEKPEIPTGSYKLSAYLTGSDLNNEGADCPYFLGETDVTVLEARETSAHVTAKVANSLVSVSYTDSFKDYMKSNYSSAVVTSLGKTIEMDEADGKPVFVKPGNIALSVTIPNPDNNSQTITLHPTTFEAKPGCHYKINLNVNGGSADASLEIKFDESLVDEDFEIDLTPELFTSKAPTVNVTGIDTFEGGIPAIEFLSGDAPEGGQYRFNITAHAGLKEVTLYLKSLGGSYVPSFGNEIELISTPGAQAKLEEMGITCLGIFRNPDKMAYIDFSNLAKYLPSGEYELSVVPKDVLTRVPKDEAKVLISSINPTLENLVGGTATYGLEKGTVYVTFNGNPSDVSFKAINEWGNFVNATVDSYEEVEDYTRAIESKKYKYTLILPDTKRETIKVQVYRKGNLEGTVDIKVLGFSVEIDAFARKAIIRLTAPASKLASLVSGLEIYRDGSLLTDVTREPSGLITVKNLEPQSSYSFTLKEKGAEDGMSYNVVTEEEKALPNGDFSAMNKELYIPSINAGGTYTGTLARQAQNKTSIRVFTPDDWGNINNITCDYDGSSNKNTWYVVPSTLGNIEAKSVTVRSVGYSHAGREIPDCSITQWWGNYWSKNHPEESWLDYAAGQLFVGDSRDNGIAFASRPSALEFDYTFEDKTGTGDKGFVKVAIYAGSKCIGSATSEISEGEGTMGLKIDNYEFNEKATRAVVYFMSSSNAKPAVVIPTGDDLKDIASNASSWNLTLNENQYNSLATGSELTISNVRFTY